MSEAEATAQPVEAPPAAEAPVAEQPTEQKEETPTAAAATEEKTETEEPAQQQEGESAEPALKAEGDKKILKTTAKIDHENKRNNNKFDPSVREVTDDPVAIRKQVEFYFGDWNFAQDKFMWESAGGSENKPIPIKTIHSFKRMRNFQPYSAVVTALKDSNFLEVTGEEDNEQVKRKNPYKPVPAAKAKAEAATVYVKGFGDETPQTQFDLETFFANYGEVKGLKLRRTNENLFKGSVFVTFIDEETAQKFLKLDPAPQWNGHDLKIMSKHDYCEEKSELIRQGKLEPNNSAPKKFFEGKAAGGGGRGQGRNNTDRDDWKKRRDNDQKGGFRDGGRGRGRGGRGGRGRGDRGRGRGGRDRNAERQNGGRRVDASAQQAESAPENSTKRPREDDNGGDQPAAKKVDTKPEVPAEA